MIRDIRDATVVIAAVTFAVWSMLAIASALEEETRTYDRFETKSGARDC